MNIARVSGCRRLYGGKNVAYALARNYMRAGAEGSQPCGVFRSALFLWKKLWPQGTQSIGNHAAVYVYEELTHSRSPVTGLDLRIEV